MKSVKSIHLFAAGLAVKIVLLFFFGSTYLRDLFIPFLDYAVQNPLANPWSHFPKESFPYGSVLFAILFVPKFLGHLIFGASALGQGPLSLFLMKLPLLVIDTLFLGTLLRFSTRSLRLLLITYWLNPALIFITYVHGQLDVATMFFAVLSIYLLTRERPGWSAVAMAAATLCKSHTIILIPLILTYLWKKNFMEKAVGQIARYLGIWLALTGLGFLPTLFARNLLYVTVASPQANRIFAMQVRLGDDRTFLLGFAVLLAALGRLCLSRRITERAVLFGAGILFGVLLLVTNPMPGWYYWVIPFLALFYSTYYTNHRLILWVLNGTFLLYFGLVEIGYHSANPLVMDGLFTVLQVSVAAALFEIWLLVIAPEMPLRQGFKPLMIGIAGNSSVGKNTFSSALADVLGEINSVILEGDDYHRWERERKEWKTFSHLDPRANHLPTMAVHTMDLLMGRFVTQPRYDHSTGAFTLPQTIKPNRTVIIQGLHALYLKGMRDYFDLKIFISTDDLIQLAWKIKRDVRERGHSVEEVIQAIEQRAGDAAAYIEPQRQFADWQIEYRLSEPITREDVIAGKEPSWHMRFIFWNDVPWNQVLDPLKKVGECEFETEEIPGDINRVIVKVTGNPKRAAIETVANDVFSDIRHITRSRRPPKWQEGLAGVCQLIALTILQQRFVHDSLYQA